MIEKPTVLILGAGASADYGFPSGRNLLLQICHHLHTKDADLPKTLLDLGFAHHKIHSFAKDLRLSMQPSVDAFLENRPEYMEIGKAALAIRLIPYEDLRTLYQRPKTPTWYEYLVNQMGANKDEFKSNRISFVTFNYDRSLEYFLYVALEATYGIGNKKKVVELLSSIPIIHVYGQLALPHYLSKDGRPYDMVATLETIKQCIAEIKIIPELADVAREFEPVTREFELAHKLISEASRICFLGFGYHPTNVSRLRVSDKFRGERVLGSAYGIEEAERRRIQRLFRPVQIHLGHIGEDVLTFIRRYPVFD